MYGVCNWGLESAQEKREGGGGRIEMISDLNLE